MRWHPLIAQLGAETLSAPDRAQLSAAELTDDELEALLDPVLEQRIEGELAAAAHHGWSILCPDDPRYPPLLRQIAVPPPVLTVRGRVDALSQPALAVVGTRRPNSYGEWATAEFVRPLAAAGVAIVSGLAIGIDGVAHRIAIEAGGTTVAVCGRGLSAIYPERHAGLAERIAEAGAVVSEFSPGMPPLPENFPRRNRIIAGLGHALLVVQAAAQSGSLSTANQAASEGRPVLAVPGRVGERVSDGVLKLIRDGGIMVRGPEDLLEEVPALAEAAGGRLSHAPVDRGALLPPTLSGTARKVFDLLPEQDERELDALLDASPLSTEAVLEGLFELELAGYVEQLPGARFRRSIR